MNPFMLGALFLLVSLAGGSLASAQAAEVTLPGTYFFESSAESPVEVAAGSYRARRQAEVLLLLRGERVVARLATSPTDHSEELERPAVFVDRTDTGALLLSWLEPGGEGWLAVGTRTAVEPRGSRSARARYRVGVCPPGYRIRVKDEQAYCVIRKLELRAVRATRCLEPAELVEGLETQDGVDLCEIPGLGTTQPAVECPPRTRRKVVPGARDRCMAKSYRWVPTHMKLLDPSSAGVP